MNIPDVRDFDARLGAREFLKLGFTAIDDIGESLYQYAEEELFDELGFTADDLDIATDRIETDLGPVFAFRDRARLSLKAVSDLVKRQRSFGQ